MDNRIRCGERVENRVRRSGWVFWRRRERRQRATAPTAEKAVSRVGVREKSVSDVTTAEVVRLDLPEREWMKCSSV